MTRRIRRIAPLQAGKMLAAAYGCLGLIFPPIFALAGMLSAFAQHTQPDHAAPAVLVGGLVLGMSIFMPTFYAAMEFVVGVIRAALDILVARWVGGFEVDVE